jgi:hypothetical protein
MDFVVWRSSFHLVIFPISPSGNFCGGDDDDDDDDDDDKSEIFKLVFSLCTVDHLMIIL